MSAEKTTKQFSGIARLYGNEGLEVFKNSHIAVIGIGGVGSWVVESLARTGIGTFTLIDLDEICISNINRQIHATTQTVGQSKIEVMAERVKTINPGCIVNLKADFIGYENLDDCLSTDYDYVVDAIDSAAIKAATIKWCKRNKVPVISIGGSGGKLDPSKIMVGDISRTKNDPLLAKVRSQLRTYHGFSRNPKRSFAVDCVYSTEQLRFPSEDGGTTFEKPGGSVSLDCTSGFGAATHFTASVAFQAVARVLEKLLRRAERLKEGSYKE